MIEIARAARPEAAANLLLRQFRHVLVQAHYDNTVRIRFRADMVTDRRVYFGKVASQIKRWQEKGGCLISWRRVDNMEGEHDAILFAECPKSLDAIHMATRRTRHLAVVWLPPTWRLHEETIAKRHKDKHPGKYVRQVRKLDLLRGILERAPLLSRDFLDRRFAPPALAASRPSGAPASREAAAPAPDTPG